MWIGWADSWIDHRCLVGKWFWKFGQMDKFCKYLCQGLAVGSIGESMFYFLAKSLSQAREDESVMTKIKKIETKDAPGAGGPYSQGTITEGFIFVSGQLPVDPKTGQIVERNIKTQTDRAMENLRAVLKAGGSDLSKVVRCDVFLKDMNDFKEMDDVYASKFVTDPKPARQTIQVGRLPLDAMIEISCIAYKG